MEEPISFWGYKEQESNLILPEHDDDDDLICFLRNINQKVNDPTHPVKVISVLIIGGQ
jgi:hypothetical protein